MAEKTILTRQFLPSSLAIVAGEMAEMIQMNERDSGKVRSMFWDRPRGTKGAPLPSQDLLRDTYDAHAALYPDELQSYVLFGSVRSGKTDGGIAHVAQLAADYPFTRILGARRTLTELHNSLIDSIEKFYRRVGVEYNIRRGDAPRIWLANGSCWIFFATEKADKQKEGKADTLGGSEFSLAVLEEANEIPRSFYETVIGRMSQRHLPAPAIFNILNPTDDRHWIYKKFIEQSDGPLKHHFNIHFDLEDNRINLGDKYVDDLKERYAGSPTMFRKFVKGLWTPSIKGTPLFRGRFSREVHVAATPLPWNQNYKLTRMWDFGFLAPAVVVFQDDESTGQIRVLRAYLGREEMIDVFGKRMVNILSAQFPGARWRDIGDIAGKHRSASSAKTEAEMLEAIIHQRLEMKKTTIEYGLTLINEQLAIRLPRGLKARNGDIPALILCPAGASELADGFEFGYCQDPDARDDVIKPCRDMRYEHSMDAFRYGICFVRTPTTQHVPKNPERSLWRSVTSSKEYSEIDFQQLQQNRKGGTWYSFGRRRA